MDLTNFDRYVTEAETRIDEDGTKYEKFCDRAKKIMEDFKVGSVGSKSTNGFREYMFCSTFSINFLFILIS